MPTLPISPLVGEMPGRAEGGVKERQQFDFHRLRRVRIIRGTWAQLADRLAGQRPPLSCRTSPPQGGVWTGDIANRCARTSRTVWRALRREV
ncbi:MAG: hypothetical protein E5Y07_09535, partial [Mesorhizobium sp.]